MIRQTPTRAAALDAMQDFVPAMGRRYENRRNYDLGPGQHSAVSTLSPFLRRRLITEQEVVAAAHAAHGPDRAEKFIQEVIWRSYFKGWLERRPQVWDSYRNGLGHDLESLDRDKRLRRDVELAEAGQTDIACFNAWAQELVTTGYLHNHARMWFASIWIFTLGLPWRLGADFFYRHLLDGDAASNTLSWRWVAGLHTRGKPYPARAQNIATYTEGRFAPDHGTLAEVDKGLEYNEPDGLPDLQPLRDVTAPKTGAPTVLLITDEDCCVTDFDLDGLDLRGAATLATSHLRSPRPVADQVVRFERGAVDDTAQRAGLTATAMQADDPSALADWAASLGAAQIVTPYVTRGPLYDWLMQAQGGLDAKGITLAEVRRDWDAAIWPKATAGFFKVKKTIPDLLDRFITS
ncbi:deoxyribodipyrimidine photo-lyase [Loktanella sp. DSM 29012]|uniref:FAD-binding domain-containing protein n=1 Tax=Loktanella sp. DSM 29012 TaxID=1881056 RepID=UPI0008D2AC8C|nr:FAD-binding domain-containing protein [Loktanella sp. DSM 29012]SEQ29866.1 deoxyribodipyrimidine photo-lyase [Loktanella sp. DSM 29012]